MTAQTLIDILFLVILICHIIKLRYMQEQCKQMWHNIEILCDYLTKTQDHLLKMQDTIKDVLEILEMIDSE